MNKNQILFILGILIALSPFYGLPQGIMTIITVLLGLAVLALSFYRTKRTNI